MQRRCSATLYRSGMKPRSILAMLLAILAAACSSESKREDAYGENPPVILISIDTLRSDRLPVYGYSGIETPAIDAFRGDSILFESAWSHYPLTLPSHASVMTGLLPTIHGVRDNVGFTVPEENLTLAEALAAEGYATGGAVSAWVLREESGVDAGFEFYDDEVSPVGERRAIGAVQRPGKETIEVAVDWIRRQNDPVFFFLHIYEPHTPWKPPQRFAEMTDDPYDGEVAYSSELIGEFLDELKQIGLYDDALIILFSDHGEGLNDHGEEEHGLFLYREAIQVPLIVKLPGGRHAGASVPEPAALVDIFPTVAEVVGSEGVSGEGTGLSLVSALEGGLPADRLVYSETYYPRYHMGWSDTQSLVDGTHHYIRAPRPELYSLTEDPAETTNLIEEERRTYFRLAEAIEPMLVETAGPSAVDPEEAAKLAALGYLGTSASVDGEELPDPKDRIETYKKMGVAFDAFSSGDYRRVVELTGPIVEENPGMTDVLDLRAKSFAKLQLWDEAVKTGRQAFERAPHAKNLALAVADYLLGAKEFEEARRHAELALESIPGPGNLTLARIALAEKDFDAAEKSALRAEDESDTELASNVVLAKIYTEAGRIPEGLQRIEKAFELTDAEADPLPEMHFIRGDLLARMGQFERAEAEFRTEIALHPQNPQTYKNMILLLVDRGRLEEANEMIFKLIDAAPAPPSYVAISDVLRVIGDERGATYWARRGLERFPNDPELRRLARS